MGENGEAARLFVTVDGNTTKATAAMANLDKQVKGAAAGLDKNTKGAAQSFKDLDGVAQGLAGNLGSLSGVMGMLGVAGVGALAAGAGRALLSLEKMREESAQLEARFAAFSGGAAQASAAMQAYDTTLGNALTTDQKMQAASTLLGLGLAKTATEAAELTRQALTLGMGIDTLAQALETGRASGLVQYGISMQQAKDRAQELQAATKGLSDTEAQAIAIKEQLAAKSKAVADMGGQAATASERLANAWDSFMDQVADTVNLEGFITGLESSITRLTQMLEGASNAGSNEAQAMQDRLSYLLDLQKRWESGERIYRFNAQANQREIEYLRNLTAEWGDAGVTAATKTANAMPKVETAVKNVSAALQSSITWFGEFAGFAESAAMWAKGQPLTQAGKMQDEYGVSQDWIGPTVLEYNKAGAERRLEAIRAAEAANERIAKSAGDDYASEMRQAASKVEGYISNAIGNSKGLLDLTGGGKDPFAPGANGPFENVYRALDVAKLGDASPWAKVLGMTQDDAKRLSEQFQKGILTPEVISKLVNVDALVKSAQMEEQSKKLLEAFSQSIAKQAGVSVNVTNELLKVADAEKAGKNMVEAAARGAEAAKASAVKKTEDIARAMIAGMIAVLNSTNPAIAQTATAAATVVAGSASNTSGAGGKAPASAPAKVVNMAGDIYSMNVADPGSAVLAAALIADRKAARLDAAMGG